MSQPPDDHSDLQEMISDNPELKKQFSYRKIIIVILIGLLLSGFLIVSTFDIEAFKKIEWNEKSLIWIFLGYIMLVTRHLAFMYRLRLITNNTLSWGSSFSVISLWLFSSAITPSTVGGAAAAVYFLKKEKLSTGKSATTSLLTVFLDQIVFAVFATLAVIIIGNAKMFGSETDCMQGGGGELPLINVFHSVKTIFWWTYSFYLVMIIFLGYGLFINAKAISNSIHKIFSWRILRRWKEDAYNTGLDIIATSKVLKKKNTVFWLKATAATLVSWFALFSISVCIIMAFFNISFESWPVLYARQFVVWMLMLIPATPGSTGIAEISFSVLMCDYTSTALAPIMALLWRIVSYYPYLIIGIAILPRWLRKVF
ncbi:MAG: flippase-like domain-containing protein [Chitinophagales bacterium]|nr:flippase-like domain-containing protein [Bacteroidota bacterium]MBP7399767.1 flippase-like domain-containing protein [Chitinophagales bacterium]MBK8486526.1 flippase-like domain-containing protein [Bacteroidota bacterium]MBK8683307.1 flippase-like domain-containing protein [Bacteroidota bacterium]MBP8754714.1 flippase-like domain-containing protein [Chitinophagales bacterium]